MSVQESLTVFVPADVVVEIDAGCPLPTLLIWYVRRENGAAQANVVRTFAEHVFYSL